jgi:hypothetical protein
MNEVVFIEFIFVRLLRIKLELELGNKMDVYSYVSTCFIQKYIIQISIIYFLSWSLQRLL